MLMKLALALKAEKEEVAGAFDKWTSKTPTQNTKSSFCKCDLSANLNNAMLQMAIVK